MQEHAMMGNCAHRLWSAPSVLLLPLNAATVMPLLKLLRAFALLLLPLLLQILLLLRTCCPVHATFAGISAPPPLQYLSFYPLRDPEG